MNYLTFDCETTTKNKGNPFTKGNKLCLVGILDDEGYTAYDIEYTDSPYGEALADIRRRFLKADVVIGFNLKFDLHWLLNYIDDLHISSPYDCQLGEFILTCQNAGYPSLEATSAVRNLGHKLDVVKLEYWDRGIDTTAIPADVLYPYLEQDVSLTRKIFDQQREELGTKKRLFQLQCQDLLILMEMERNGIYYDTEKALQRGQETRARLQEIDKELRDISGVSCINWNSPDNISSYLYGGTVWEKYREQYTRTLKDGTVKLKERWSTRAIELPRLVSPDARFESADTRGLDDANLRSINREREVAGRKPLHRSYSTAEPVLRELSPRRGKAKEVIARLLERSRLEQLDSTYYTGLVEKLVGYEWGERDFIHGQFNQTVAKTGRLSSKEPNLQNFAGEIKELFYSRYE
jgi:DNA polymerase I-like protein with 3'-5' exonuclease and polymerase domains